MKPFYFFLVLVAIALIVGYLKTVSVHLSAARPYPSHTFEWNDNERSKK